MLQSHSTYYQLKCACEFVIKYLYSRLTDNWLKLANQCKRTFDTFPNGAISINQLDSLLLVLRSAFRAELIYMVIFTCIFRQKIICKLVSKLRLLYSLFTADSGKRTWANKAAIQSVVIFGLFTAKMKLFQQTSHHRELSFLSLYFKVSRSEGKGNKSSLPFLTPLMPCCSPCVGIYVAYAHNHTYIYLGTQLKGVFVYA